MHYEITGANAATAHLEAGDHLAFDGDFLRDDKIGSPFPPLRWREALLPRLITGRLFFFNRDARVAETISLSGSCPHSGFHSVEVPEGEAYWVKLSYLAAFSFEPGARFQSVRRWLDPVTWLIGASRSVIVHGPANLLFYGGGLKVPATSSIQTDLVVVFDASVPFQVSAYDPGPRRFTHLINAFSSKVFMTFQGGGPLLQITTGNVRKQRFIAIFRLLLSILLGVLATRAILGN